jgi:hypothetical protein
MAFQQELVFVSGLDKSYSSHKRALVRRNVIAAREHRAKERRQGTSTDSQSSAPPREAGIDDAATTALHANAPEALLDVTRLASRYVGQAVDHRVTFDPFDSTSIKLDTVDQRLVEHCAW